MATIEQSIDVDVPVSTAYNQWTQFEEFPRFMDGVEELRQIDDTHLHWIVSHNGKRHEFDTEITEQQPDTRVAWRTTEGTAHAGTISFTPLDDARCTVAVRMEWEPEGMLEELGAALGSDDRRVKADLESFKELIEGRGAESGAWRGTVKQGETS